MQRLGDLLPETARRLGLDDELRLARAIATWSAIVAQEMRLRSTELLAAFRVAPGGLAALELRLIIRRV